MDCDAVRTRGVLPRGVALLVPLFVASNSSGLNISQYNFLPKLTYCLTFVENSQRTCIVKVDCKHEKIRKLLLIIIKVEKQYLFFER